MTFTQILETAREMAKKADISGVGFMAVQINIVGEGEGVFYVEVKDGCIHVEPYEYYDRNCAITISNADFLKFLDGDIDVGKAYDEGVIKVDGDLGKAAWFSDLLHRK